MSKNKTGLSIHHTRLAKMVNTPLKDRGVEPAALGNGVVMKS